MWDLKAYLMFDSSIVLLHLSQKAVLHLYASTKF